MSPVLYDALHAIAEYNVQCDCCSKKAFDDSGSYQTMQRALDEAKILGFTEIVIHDQIKVVCETCGIQKVVYK